MNDAGLSIFSQTGTPARLRLGLPLILASASSRAIGGGYGEAARDGAPGAIQVADRWHLMENASAAFLRAVSRSMRLIRQALSPTIIDPVTLTSAERLQYEGYRRREDAGKIIKALEA